MNPRIDQLVKSLLQKDTLEQCSLPELQQFAERHPYFGAAQLLLTKKMQTESPDGYDQQLQKTLLFFHNPMWVEHLLNDTGSAEVLKAKKEKAAEAIVEKKDTAEPATAADEVIVVAEPALAPVLIHPTPSEPVIEAAVPETIELPQEESIILADEPVITIPNNSNETVSTKADELLFEPYHTVDYFASQGIKFKEEEKPTDKFGQQLKSFTEWLKTLKKAPVAEVAKNAEPASERKVEEMAETSIKDREVLTEAMAEVWEKQGNSSKAIDIYSKLSLLEPSKSAYFAAKIEDLKKQN